MHIEQLLRDIQNLLNQIDFASLNPKLHHIPSNYGQLQEAAILRELSQELIILKSLFSGSLRSKKALRNAFKTLCSQRELQNHNTCLNFNAMPEGLCNRLYFDITLILFNPNSLSDLLAILMPSINACLSLEYSDFLSAKTESSKSLDRVEIGLQALSLNNLAKYPPHLNLFTQFVTGDEMIFMLDAIECIPLTMHHKLHNQLHSYPCIKDKLYKHNEEFKQLYFDIELLEKKGTTPNEFLTYFTKELIRSGSNYTGNTFASNFITDVCQQFRNYLDQLPNAFREELLALTTDDKAKSLQDILEKQLATGACVETIAREIKSIQANQNHKEFLQQTPFASKEQLLTVTKKYRKPIAIIGYDSAKALPKLLRKSLLQHIQITSSSDYLDLLINLPIDEYQTFLQHALILCQPALPPQLAGILSMLNAEQQSAFYEAIFNAKKQFGGLNAIVNFTITHNPVFALNWLKGLSKGKRIKISSINDLSLLHQAIKTSNLELFQLFWDDFSPVEKQIVLDKKQVNNYHNLLHYAAEASNPSFYLLIVKDLSEEVTWDALLEKNKSGFTPIHLAIANKQPEVLNTIWESLSKEGASAVKLRDKRCDFLYYALNRGTRDSWLLIWNSYSKEELIALNDKNMGSNNRLIPQIMRCRNFEALTTFLNILPPESRLDAVFKEEDTSLHTLENSQVFHALLDSLPSVEGKTSFDLFIDWAICNQNKDVLNAMLKHLPADITLTPSLISKLLEHDKDSYIAPYLLNIFENKALLLAIWSSLSKTERITFLKLKTTHLNTILHLVIGETDVDFDLLQLLLDFIEESQRITFLSEINASDESPLTDALNRYTPNLKLVQTLWNYLPNIDSFKQFQVKSNNGFINSNLLYKLTDTTADFDILNSILESIEENQRAPILLATDKYKGSPLNYAINNNNHKLFQTLWNHLPQANRLELMRTKSKELINILERKNTQILLTMLDSLDDPQKYTNFLKLLSHFSSEIIRNNMKLINLLWKYVPESERINVLLEPNNSNISLIHWAAQNSSSERFFTIWDSLSEADKKTVATYETKIGTRLLEFAAQRSTPDIWRCVWSYYSIEDRLLSFNRKSASSNRNLLDWAETNDHALKTMFEFLQGYNTQWDYLSNQQLLIKYLMLLIDSWDNIAEENREKLKNEFLKSAFGSKDLAFIAKILQLFPEYKEEAIAIINKNQSKALSHEFIYTIWQDLNDAERVNAIQMKDSGENNLFHWACQDDKNFEFFSTLWNELPDPIRLNALVEKNLKKTSVFSAAFRSYPKQILDLIFKESNIENVIQIFLLKNVNEESLFYSSFRHGDFFIFIWQYLSPQHRFFVLQELNKINENLIHREITSGCHQKLILILKDLKHYQDFSILHSVDKKGDNAIHLALNSGNPQFLITVLDYINQADKIQLLQVKNNEDLTPLNLATKNCNFNNVQILLREIPEKDKANLILATDKEGKSALDWAIFKSKFDIFSLLWKSMSKQEQLKIVHTNKTLLKASVEGGDFAIWQLLWKCYSKQEQVLLVNERNEDNCYILLTSAIKCKSNKILSCLLLTFSEEERLIIFNEKNSFGNTLFHYAAKVSDSGTLFVLLSFIAANKRLGYLLVENRFGITPLLLVAKNTYDMVWKSLQHILSQKDYSGLVKIKNSLGNTPLHVAAEYNYNFMIELLKSIPDEERLEAILDRNKYGNAPLHRAAKNKNERNLRDMLGLLKEDCEIALQGDYVRSPQGLPVFGFFNKRSLDEVQRNQGITNGGRAKCQF